MKITLKTNTSCSLEVPVFAHRSTIVNVRSRITNNIGYGHHYVWSDGTNIYYSKSGTHNILDIATGAWSYKTWSEFSGMYLENNAHGYNFWTDGTNIYYSDGSYQFVYNKDSDTWGTKTWKGLTNFSGYYVWSDGTNIYYSYGDSQYVLNGDTWTEKVWNITIEGSNIWSDGTNIYYSYGDSQYVLNGDTWETKTWSGELQKIYTSNLWTDGSNIYYSSGSDEQYYLNRATGVWATQHWGGVFPYPEAQGFWTDGTNIYYSYTFGDTSGTYGYGILLPATAKLYVSRAGGWQAIDSIT